MGFLAGGWSVAKGVRRNVQLGGLFCWYLARMIRRGLVADRSWELFSDRTDIMSVRPWLSPFGIICWCSIDSGELDPRDAMLESRVLKSCCNILVCYYFGTVECVDEQNASMHPLVMHTLQISDWPTQRLGLAWLQLESSMHKVLGWAGDVLERSGSLTINNEFSTPAWYTISFRLKQNVTKLQYTSTEGLSHTRDTQRYSF